MKQLNVSPTLNLPLEIVTQKTSILAKSGAGKSNGAATIVEEVLEAQAAGVDVHVVVLDPKGDWWGLRSSGDGKGPGYSVIVFGSQDALELGHADVLLEPAAGDVVADFVVDEHASVVLDVSDFSGTEQARFAADFCERLRRRKAKEPSPCLVVLEEADELCPQRVEGEKARMVGAVQRIAKRGRFAGLGFLAVTQRSASFNKDVLTQSDTLIVMQTTAPQDIKAIDAWVEHHPDQKKREQLLAEVSSLQKGEAYLWSPSELGVFEKFRFRLRRTYDSGRTPRVGEKRAEPKVRAAIDLEALKRRMAASIEKAKQDDPRELRKQLAALRKDLSAAQRVRVEPEVRVERVEVVQQVVPEGHLKALEDLSNNLVDRVRQLRALPTSSVVRQALVDPRILTSHPAAPVPAAPAPSRLAQRRRCAHVPGDASLPKGERVVLTAIAQHDEGVDKEQLTVLTGYKRSARDTYLQRLRAKGLIEASGTALVATEDGVEALGADYESLPTGDALRAHWMGKLPLGERRVLEVLVGAYPGVVAREVLDEATGYKRSARDTYLQRLGARRLVERTGDGVRASPRLFDGGA
jgi:uncharacterized protein